MINSQQYGFNITFSHDHDNIMYDSCHFDVNSVESEHTHVAGGSAQGIPFQPLRSLATHFYVKISIYVEEDVALIIS